MKVQIVIWSVAAAIFALDQFAKWLVIKHIPANMSIQVIPGFFDLVNIRNRGAAFGFLNRHDMDWQFWLFLIATGLAVIAIMMLAKSARNRPVMGVGLGLILGGALGNLVDRIRWRAVVDFLDFYLADWHWPAFNVADMGICIGAGLVCLAIWQEREKPGKSGKIQQGPAGNSS